MSHDAWAAFSAIELARDCQSAPRNWFATEPAWEYQTYATREPRVGWPQPDGALEITRLTDNVRQLVAVEFKRVNEGVHGVLTGLGQVQAYLHKGFSASVLVLPRSYENLPEPGQYVRSVLEQNAPGVPVGVFSYDAPDLSASSPFAGRLTCHKPSSLAFAGAPGAVPRDTQRAGRQRTQWAHVREGSTVPDPIYRYLVATRDTAARSEEAPNIRQDLVAAARRLNPTADPVFFLSNTSEREGRVVADRAWRRFWYHYVLTPEVQELWRVEGGTRVWSSAPTRLVQWNGDPIVFFAARADSIKQRLARDVSRGMAEENAWDAFAKNIRERAHQYREDIDSGAEAAGFIDSDGRMTELGFRFLSTCDRAGGANNPQPIAILRRALLVEGGLLALLHYVHAISEDAFRADVRRFADQTQLRFQSVPYREFVFAQLADKLRVAARSALRSGSRRRPPLEGELITLRHLGLVGGFRLGVGLEIKWPAVFGAVESAG